MTIAPSYRLQFPPRGAYDGACFPPTRNVDLIPNGGRIATNLGTEAVVSPTAWELSVRRVALVAGEAR